MGLRSLVEEIMFSGAPLLEAEEKATDSGGKSGNIKSILGIKHGRGFCHNETKLYMKDSGRLKKKKFMFLPYI